MSNLTLDDFALGNKTGYLGALADLSNFIECERMNMEIQESSSDWKAGFMSALNLIQSEIEEECTKMLYHKKEDEQESDD